MGNLIKTLINDFKQNPKRLFLIDGSGALISAFLLSTVLVRLSTFIGMPIRTLYFLAVFPVCFAIYDGIIYLFGALQLDRYLRGIAFANMTYCFICIAAAIYHRETLSVWGWAYLLSEIVIILGLACIELKVAN